MDCQPLYRESIFALGTMVVIMTAGTAVVMWLGELITDRGVGNGMSILMFTSIAARIPNEGQAILKNSGGFAFVLILMLGFSIIAAVVFVEQAQRRIPVQYAKRMIGRRMYGGTSTYLPMKVNMAGVIPVIFASSLLYIPQLLSQLNGSSTSGLQLWINNHLLDQQDWIHITTYFLLIIFFTYFYVGITFNPEERADDMKKYGGFIPGIRPGRPDRGVPAVRAVPDHAARCPLPGHHRRDPELLLLDDRWQQPELPVRRHRRADHGRRGAGHGQADREPAHAAQLRRVPALMAGRRPCRRSRPARALARRSWPVRT